MHDILEGVLQYHTKEMLKYYILEKKWFSLDNQGVVSFDYDYSNDSNSTNIEDKTLIKW